VKKFTITLLSIKICQYSCSLRVVLYWISAYMICASIQMGLSWWLQQVKEFSSMILVMGPLFSLWKVQYDMFFVCNIGYCVECPMASCFRIWCDYVNSGDILFIGKLKVYSAHLPQNSLNDMNVWDLWFSQSFDEDASRHWCYAVSAGK